MVILSADDWVCNFCFVCGLDEASCTECYWWLGDARSSRGFLCVSSHYLILPRVSSGQTGDGKSECQHSRNRLTKMDWNG